MPKPLFSSAREARLWLWLAVVLAAIWSSLGLAGRLAAILREKGLLGPVFVIAFGVLALAVAGRGLQRLHKSEVWVWVGVAAAYTLTITRLFVAAEERTHLVEYGLVALIILEALEERGRQGALVRSPGTVAIIATAALGWVDEGIQHLLPNRIYDLRDVGFNALAGLMAVTARLTLAWARRKTGL